MHPTFNSPHYDHYLRICILRFVLMLVLLPPHIGPTKPATAAPAGPGQVDPDLWVTNGTVFAYATAGTTLYMGGAFSYIGPPTGAFVGIDTTSAVIQQPWPRVVGVVNTIISDGANGWFIGGQFSAVGGIARGNLAHIRADGTLDPGWNPATNGEVYALAISGNTLYVGGAYRSIGGQSRRYLAAVDTTSGAVHSWNPDPNNTVYALVLIGNILYAGGLFTTVSGLLRGRLAAFEITTGTITAWHPNADATVFTIAASGDTIYVGGRFRGLGGKIRNYLAAIDTQSGQATAWNPNSSGSGVAEVFALAVSGTTVYVGGTFTQIAGLARSRLAAIDAVTGLPTDWAPNPNGTVRSIVVSGNSVYIGGAISRIAGQNRGGLAAFDITTGNITSWNPNPVLAGSVNAFGVSGNIVFAGGDFRSMGGIARKNLAALDLITGQLTPWQPKTDYAVFALAAIGSRMYIGGNFAYVNGQPHNALAAVDTTLGQLIAWNPSIIGTVRALAASGTTLYVGGSFSHRDQTELTNLAAIDTNDGSFTRWSPNPNWDVSALAVHAGTLYVAGAFTSISGQARSSFAAFDMQSGTIIERFPSTDREINAIVANGSRVYIGGTFTSVGGQPRSNLAAIDVVSGNVTAWAPITNHEINALALSGSSIYAGGIGGRGQLIAIDAQSGHIANWGPSLGLYIYTILVNASTVYVGGNFIGAAGLPLQSNAAVGAEQVVGLSVSPTTSAEDAPTHLAYTVTRTNGAADPLTVNFTVGGTATYQSDYTQLGATTFSANAGSIVIPAGQTSATVALTPIADSTIEPAESIILTLAAGNYIVSTPAGVSSTIVKDQIPTITIAASDASVSEVGLQVGIFTVTRAGPTTAPLLIKYSVSGTAIAGGDYTPLPGTLVIPAGRSSADIRLTPIDDIEIESIEQVLLTLTPDSSYRLGAHASATALIADNESTSQMVGVVVADPIAVEHGPDDGLYTFTRSGPLGASLTIKYTLSGTATAGSDYLPLTGSIVIPASRNYASIALTPIDDPESEGAETVILILTPDTAYTISTSSSGTITIDDTET